MFNFSHWSHHVKSGWMLAVSTVVLLPLTGFFLIRAFHEDPDTIRLCLGEEVMLREDLVKVIHSEAAKCKLHVILSSGSRGEDTVNRTGNGAYDAAIVFGGLGLEHPDVCQVACLRGEPLHLFVKANLVSGGLSGLHGKRVNVGPGNGETQVTARRVLKHMGVKAGKDFIEEYHDIEKLLSMTEKELPDAIFLSAVLPSATGKTLVDRFGYRLLEIPFGEVLSLQNPAIFDVKIPANTYGYEPPVPQKSIHSVGCYTMVIANRQVPARAVYRLLELLCESDLPRRLGKMPLEAETLLRIRDFPLHAGVTRYLARNDPWVNQKFMGEFSKLKEILLTGFSALLLFWGWLRRRPAPDYKGFLQKIALLELELYRAAEEKTFSNADRDSFLADLLRLKIEALEKARDGLLPGDKPLTDFLQRIQQVQNTLNALPTNMGHPSLRIAG